MGRGAGGQGPEGGVLPGREQAPPGLTGRQHRIVSKITGFSAPEGSVWLLWEWASVRVESGWERHPQEGAQMTRRRHASGFCQDGVNAQSAPCRKPSRAC